MAHGPSHAPHWRREVGQACQGKGPKAAAESPRLEVIPASLLEMAVFFREAAGSEMSQGPFLSVPLGCAWRILRRIGEDALGEQRPGDLRPELVVGQVGFVDSGPHERALNDCYRRDGQQTKPTVPILQVRERRVKETDLKEEISDALLLDRSLAGLPIVAFASGSLWRRSPPVVAVRGPVPTPELRDTAMRVVERELSRRHPAARAEDRLAVDPMMGKHVA